MKKIILLFVLAIGISSCSNDDTKTSIVAPLEGDWLLVYHYGGDPPPGDISLRNIRYHFKGNIVKIAENGESIDNDSTFLLTQEDGYYTFIFHEYIDVQYRVIFSNGNKIASFDRMNLDTGFTLKKIE